jgi:nucleotide-binding universal stress UspA family protein
MAEHMPIVVGFDGSPCSIQAVNWALTEAASRSGQLVLCHVGKPRQALGDGEDAAAVSAERTLARSARCARTRARGIDVVPMLLFGNPARQLVDAASRAALLVVGRRGNDGFRELRLGSVSAQVARHARCTVVVVPDASAHTDSGRRRHVVVGVDGSAGSSLALSFAFEQAARRGAELRAVYVFDATTIQTMANLPRAETRHLHVTAANTLHDLLCRHARDNPDVIVSSAVMSGAPATTLISAAADAELLVLGARGHGDLATLMLGSTCHTVLHNATCPVAVVRGTRPALAHAAAGPSPARRFARKGRHE